MRDRMNGSLNDFGRAPVGETEREKRTAAIRTSFQNMGNHQLGRTTDGHIMNIYVEESGSGYSMRRSISRTTVGEELLSVCGCTRNAMMQPRNVVEAGKGGM